MDVTNTDVNKYPIHTKRGTLVTDPTVSTIIHNIRRQCYAYTQQLINKEKPSSEDLNSFFRGVIMEYPDNFTYTIKFVRTFKQVKFLINKDEVATEVEVQLLEKTLNIVNDIDNIYQVNDRIYLNKLKVVSGQLLTVQTLKEIFTYGVTPSPRENEIFKAPSICIKDVALHEMTNPDVLYWDVIKSVENSNVNNVVAIDMVFTSGKHITITTSEDRVSSFKSGYIFIINSKGSFAAMSPYTAKKHLSVTNLDDLYMQQFEQGH